MRELFARRGLPFPLFGATLNWPGDDANSAATFPYVMSCLHCGSEKTGFTASADLALEDSTLATVVALSGAGSPLPTPPTPLLFCLMVISNLHVGRWLPKPILERRRPRAPTALRLLQDWFHEPSKRNFQFVTDGDDDHSLALIPLLRRRARSSY